MLSVSKVKALLRHHHIIIRLTNIMIKIAVILLPAGEGMGQSN